MGDRKSKNSPDKEQTSEQKKENSEKKNTPTEADSMQEKDEQIRKTGKHEDSDDDDSHFGGLPTRDLKKNLGCGG